MNYFFRELSRANIAKLERNRISTVRHRVDDVPGTFINEKDFTKAIKVLEIQGDTEAITDEIFEVKMTPVISSTPVVRSVIKEIKTIPTVKVEKWDGKAESEFVKVAQKFADGIRLNVAMDVPHAHSQELRGTPSLFYIHIWSAKGPAERKNAPPEEIFGIDVECNDSQIVPKKITGMPIMSDNVMVGELIGTDLYIFHDICHNGTSKEIEMFSRFLQEAKRYLSFDKVTFDKRDKDAFPFACQRELSLEIERVKELIKEAERQNKEFKSNIMNVSRKMISATSALEGTDFDKKFGEEFDKLLSFEKIVKVKVIGSKITVETKELYCTDPRTSKVHAIGKFEITIDFNYYKDEDVDRDDDDPEGLVLFKNLNKSVEGFENGMQAPHVFQRGHACWGNHFETMRDLIINAEIPSAILQAIRFIESVNTDDEAGSYICYWPFKGESEAKRLLRLKNRCVKCKAENCDNREDDCEDD